MTKTARKLKLLRREQRRNGEAQITSPQANPLES
jgi:hypothetical protein